LNRSESKAILESLLKIIKSNTSKIVKISNFGSFYTHQSPKRIGRNPKTKKEYVIPKRKKLVFKASNNLKNILN